MECYSHRSARKKLHSNNYSREIPSRHSRHWLTTRELTCLLLLEAKVVLEGDKMKHFNATGLTCKGHSHPELEETDEDEEWDEESWEAEDNYGDEK